MLMKNGKWSIVLKTTLVLLSVMETGCNNDPVSYNVMMVHAATGTQEVDFYLQENLIASQIPYKGNCSYGLATLEDGDLFKAEVRSSSNGATLATEFNSDLIDGEHYSLFIFGTESGFLKEIFNDTYTNPNTGESMVRFIHLSQDAPAINVLANGVEVVSNKEYYGENKFNGATGFQDVTSGVYNISFQEVSSGKILFSINNIVFEDGKAYTLYACGLMNGTGNEALGLGMVTMN